MVRVRNRLVNPVVRALSRGPAHRLLGRHLVVLGYTGRRTGRRYELPVMTAPDGADLVVLVGGAAGKTWWRNLAEGPVDITVRRDGQDEPRRARLLLPGSPGRDDAVAAYRSAFPRVTVAPADPLVVLETGRSG
ncbi:nitroreductase/quinone reductase family protein [Geodermatophilus sp. SYSU D00696]